MHNVTYTQGQTFRPTLPGQTLRPSTRMPTTRPSPAPSNRLQAPGATFRPSMAGQTLRPTQVGGTVRPSPQPTVRGQTWRPSPIPTASPSSRMQFPGATRFPTMRGQTVKPTPSPSPRPSAGPTTRMMQPVRFFSTFVLFHFSLSFLRQSVTRLLHSFTSTKSLLFQNHKHLVSITFPCTITTQTNTYTNT